MINIISNTMGEQPRRRVVLFPCPFQGHINPMLQLATILHTHSKGRLSVIIVHTHFNSPNSSKYPNFTFLPISDGISSSGTEVYVQDLATLILRLNGNCLSPFRDCLVNNILFKQDEPPVSCIISDDLMYFTQSVADDLQLPRLALRTTSALMLFIRDALPLICEKTERELEAPVRELPPFKVKDLKSVQTVTDKLDGTYQIIRNILTKIKASSGLILNSCESLEKSALEMVRDKFHVPNFAIGPFNKWVPDSFSSLLEEDQSCLNWLNTQAPSSVIYISFGSIAALDEAQFVEVALGIIESEQPFLWVIRPGLVARSRPALDNEGNLTELFPQKFRKMMDSHSGRGCIAKWAPQRKVLAHPAVGGFWTHSGWNSTLESICEGVPMLCSPSFGDQMVNARYVSEVWKVGSYLENGLERREIETYIRRIMAQENNKKREEMMIKVRNLKEKAEICVKKGGSSYKSLESLTDCIFSL